MPTRHLFPTTQLSPWLLPPRANESPLLVIKMVDNLGCPSGIVINKNGMVVLKTVRFDKLQIEE